MRHIVGFSGGIDSQAVARWVLNRFPAEDVLLLNSDAGENEDPMTMAFVEEYSAKVFPVTLCNAIVSDMWKTEGFAETRGFVGSDKLTFDRMMGFNRVGCAPCINSGKDDILNWLHRRPEMIDKIRGWEAKLGKTYFAPCVPGLYTNTIDQVIEWAGTDHGGRQTNMLRVLNEHPACESKYGLCE